MDLSVKIEDTLLNIRTAVLIETNKGYLFEFDKKNNYYFMVGGRITTQENSEDAAKREVLEELGIDIKSIEIAAITETFFTEELKKHYHEICFYYRTQYEEEFVLPENFYAIKPELFKNFDIRPRIIDDIIANKKGLIHIINRE